MKLAIDRVLYTIYAWGSHEDPIRLVRHLGVGDIIGSLINVAVGKKCYDTWPAVVSNPDGSIKQRLDFHTEKDGFGVSSKTLLEVLRDSLSARLREKGVGEAEAAKIARTFVDEFHAAPNPTLDLNDPAQASAIIDIAVLASRATRVAGQFEEAAKLALPERAPEIWMERDRSRDETPIEFLNRVWGRWMEAGVLYQSDIKRLGDPTLVKTIRTYCHRQGVDASTVLPPPQSARLERALAQAEPGSPLETLIRERLRGRDRAARHHRKPKAL